MKLLKFCLAVLIVAISFSACERQGEVINIVDGTPSNADTVLPLKFKTNHSDSLTEKHEENLKPVFKR
ncbi:MAG TPA: hypothetical protein VIJ75_19405 [Hanamia sp.]